MNKDTREIPIKKGTIFFEKDTIKVIREEEIKFDKYNK